MTKEYHATPCNIAFLHVAQDSFTACQEAENEFGRAVDPFIHCFFDLDEVALGVV